MSCMLSVSEGLSETTVKNSQKSANQVAHCALKRIKKDRITDVVTRNKNACVIWLLVHMYVYECIHAKPFSFHKREKANSFRIAVWCTKTEESVII